MRTLPTIPIEWVCREACRVCNMHPDDITRLTWSGEASRCDDVVMTRRLAMWMCRRLTTASLPDIARAVNLRSHSTVVLGIRKFDELLDSVDPDAVLAVTRLAEAFGLSPKEFLSHA